MKTLYSAADPHRSLPNSGVKSSSGEDTEKGVFRENSTASVQHITFTLVNQDIANRKKSNFLVRG